MKSAKKYLSIFLVIVITGALLVGCTNENALGNDDSLKDKQIKELENKVLELETEITSLKNQIPEETNNNTNLLFQVINVIEVIKDKDMEELASYVHPTKGVRFTAYDYIDTEWDQVFLPEDLPALTEDNQEYRWGYYDGSGDPIDLTFNEYYDEFIYDEDFANPEIIGNNISIGRGNTINNIEEAYPDAHFIEFHFSGFDPEFAGIDWKSLKLVFEEENGTWYLVGVVHGQWTI